jgi:predicted GTPase
VEVRIGVLHSPKELSLEIDGTPDDISKAFDDALQKDDSVLWLTDAKGRRVGVPADRVAYVEIETEGGAKRVGFGG